MRRKIGLREIGALSRLDIQFVNRFNRPIRFIATDVNGTRYSLSGEERSGACGRARGRVADAVRTRSRAAQR